MSSPGRGEVWLADLGIAAKVRPVLVVSVPFGDRDYALVKSFPHTTQPRGASFEVRVPIRHPPHHSVKSSESVAFRRGLRTRKAAIPLTPSRAPLSPRPLRKL